MNKEEAKLSRITPPAPVLPTAVKRPTIEISEEQWMLDGNVEISRSFDVTMIRHPRS